MDEGKKRMAVLVGCNYPNTRNELHGCINDVLTMKEVLVKRFGFDLSHVQLLTDAPGSVVLPTGANIKKALGHMIDQAEAGDVLFFHYSGHGTRIPSAKPGHPFRQDEAIVPCDFNLITDLDFRQLVNRLPKGASLTILSDSCHSGGLIDREKEQIGPNAATTNNNPKVPSHSPKAIPFESILQHLASLTNISTSDIGTHFLEFFGSDASLKFRLPPLERDLFESINGDEGILLSGCQANETSADMSPHEGGGRSFGAFSNAVQMVLKEHSGQLSNKQLVMMARDVLQAQGFEQQHPCLYCSDQNAGSTFLWQPEC
ncbi:METACASPASE-9 [Salix koriyanagi]|uniref:METACASPASE-9 n=1 Tax=Salix koriyanagi TaxID=2511006 RepID=A0A9Q0VFX2_9ROSI|nr:METACASPASE-9 [Salix koriyanagi]